MLDPGNPSMKSQIKQLVVVEGKFLIGMVRCFLVFMLSICFQLLGV